MWILFQNRRICVSAGDLFTMALTTFVSQNLGAKQYDRAKKGARFGVLCSIIIAELIGVVIYTAAPVLIAAFNSEPDVVHYGVMQSRTIALFYFLLAFSHLHRCGASWFGKCIGSNDRHAVCMVSVPCKLYHGYGSFYPGYPRDLLGVSIDLEY